MEKIWRQDTHVESDGGGGLDAKRSEKRVGFVGERLRRTYVTGTLKDLSKVMISLRQSSDTEQECTHPFANSCLTTSPSLTATATGTVSAFHSDALTASKISARSFCVSAYMLRFTFAPSTPAMTSLSGA